MNRATPTYIFVIFIALFFSLTALAEKKSEKYYLSLLRINNEKLTLILDSIINHEMTCDYYSPDLIFAVHAQITGNFNELMIGSVGFSTIRLGNEQGCFEYRGHWFIVYGQYLDNALFSKRDERKLFAYCKRNDSNQSEPNELILNIIEDDSFSFWVYEHIDGDFVLIEMHTYCK